ncbi:MAG: peptide ABC transporter substrate-binding protein, partial [bacterium]
GNNECHWSNAEFDRMIAEAKNTADNTKRFEIMHKAENLLISEMPICPIYFYVDNFLQKPYVKNVKRNVLGEMDFSGAYVEGKR